eukprot:4267522-Prymnesium_polylepis.3
MPDAFANLVSSILVDVDRLNASALSDRLLDALLIQDSSPALANCRMRAIWFVDLVGGTARPS